MAAKYKQQADGRYRAKVWDGTYHNGTRHYVYLTSTKSSRDLERMVSEYEQKRDKGMITVSSDLSIYEYALRWLECEKSLSESATKAMYSNIINVHLKPFENIPFECFTYQNVQDIINENLDHPRTCQQIVLTLKQIGQSAELDKLLPVGGTNEVFRRVQIPKYKAEEKKPLTDEQCDAVYDALVTHNLPPRSTLFVALIYFCGLRREEALAVKYEDIHSFAIEINKAVHLGDSATEIKPPKTARGYRTVPIPAEAIPIIRDALKELKPNAEGYLFTMDNGRIITKSSYRRMWESIEKALGFECSAHIYRHTYCTKLCYEAYTNRTISIKQIAKLLGDTEAMVNNVYSHIYESKEHTGEALRSVFGNHLGNRSATNS